MNSKRKVALVGYGFWGPNVANKIVSNPKFDLVVICDFKKDRLLKAREVFGDNLEYYKDFLEVLNREDIEAVFITTNTSTHYELSKKTLLSGKSIFVEKPFTTSSAQIEELIQLAQNNNLNIHVDHLMVFHPAIKKIKTLIDSGILGKIEYFESSRMNLGRIKTDHGPIWDLAIHDLSIIDYLFPEVSFVEGSEINNHSKLSFSTISSLNLRYTDFIANIRSSWVSPLKIRNLALYGKKSTIVFNDIDQLNKITVYNLSFLKEFDNEYKDYVIKHRISEGSLPFYENEDALANSVEAFAQQLENKEVISETSRALRLVRIIENLTLSYYDEKN